MSRIEQALEKAAHLRNTAGGNVAARQAEVKPPGQAAPEQHVPPAPPPGEALPGSDNPFVATLNDPHSPVSEEYRKLKSIVSAYARQGDFKNVIMVTSSVSSEGKSLTSLNLAITLAQEFDHTVLLVDADLRKPSIQNYLGMESARGLSEYLAEGVDLGSLLIKTGIGRLTLLPAGTPVRNPVELFSSQKMKAFVSEIKNRYHDRYIIIDTPPVLPFAETRSLAEIVDGILLVVREGQTTPENIGDTIKAIDKSRLIGAVYNDATMANLAGRYQYYHYGYGYNQKPAEDRGGNGSAKEEAKPKKSGAGKLMQGLFRRGKSGSGEASKAE